MEITPQTDELASNGGLARNSRKRFSQLLEPQELVPSSRLVRYGAGSERCFSNSPDAPSASRGRAGRSGRPGNNLGSPAWPTKPA